ncbi:MAG: hypothetical protein LIO90_09790 [Bacteroidales bacterium]|nr:hypothetical protein [Bacteroidales bacterium]
MADKKYIFIRTDETRRSLYTSLLENVCQVINQAVGTYKDHKWEIDPATEDLQEWLHGNCDNIKRIIEAEFRQDFKNFTTAAARRYFDDVIEEAKAEAERVLKSSVTDRVKALAGNDRQKLEALDIVIPLVQSKDGKADFDPAAVKELASDLVPYDPQVIAFIKRAKALFHDLCKFHQDVKRLSHGEINGWSDLDDGTAILSSDGTNLWLDLRPMAKLDFGLAEAITNQPLEDDGHFHVGDVEDAYESFLKLLEDVEATPQGRRNIEKQR